MMLVHAVGVVSDDLMHVARVSLPPSPTLCGIDTTLGAGVYLAANMRNWPANSVTCDACTQAYRSLAEAADS